MSKNLQELVAKYARGGLKLKSTFPKPTQSIFARIYVFEQLLDTATYCKTVRSFKMQEQKVFVFDKCHPGEVGVKTVCCQDEVFSSFLKKGRKLSQMDAAVKIPKTNKVQVPKKKDVKKLMAFFEIPADAEDFYKDVMSATNTKGHEE